MLSSQTTAALVAGARKAPPPVTVHVRALRAFMLAGAIVAPGAEVEVGADFASELGAAGKAARVAAPAGRQPVKTAGKTQAKPADDADKG